MLENNHDNKTILIDDVYEVNNDIQIETYNKITNTKYIGFKIGKHPEIIDNDEYFKIRQMLNIEQQAIVKDIVCKKVKNKTPLHLFLTSRVSTSKTFTAKMIYQALLCIYNNTINNNPDKPKGIVVAYIGKETYNISGMTIHFAFHIPFNKL